MSGAPYEMIDAGDGRRLERFGSIVVDRPAPAARSPRRAPEAWDRLDARFERDGAADRWLIEAPLPDPWLLDVAGLRLELRLAAAGQVGVFPEQGETWDRLASCLVSWCAQAGRRLGRPPEVLSLFAYTGATSLACAMAGARVAHVDASRTAVAWAGRNASRSGAADRPVRWIVEDARTFVRREGRRGRRYDGIVLDPPSYGHGPEGREWRLERDLEPLLGALGELGSPDPAFVLLTAHSPAYGPERLAELIDRRGWGGRVTAAPLALTATSGARLDLGASAWWSPA